MRPSWIALVIVLAVARVASAATMTTQLGNTSLGTAHVGVTSATTRSVRIRNTASSGGTLDFTVASDNAEFTASPASGSIAPGAFTDVTIAFTPTDRGARTATLTISGNDAANPSDTFSLTATGTSGNLTLAWTGSPGALSFGTVAIAGGTSTGTITISNPAPANEALVVSLAITSGMSDYAAPVTQNVSVAVGASLPVTITFDPTDANTRTGVATITANDAFDTQEMVNLTGVGQGAVVAAMPASLDFGTVAVGSFGDQTLRIRNTGNQPASITALSTGSSVYTLVSPPTLPLALAANAFVDLTVRFTPVDGSIVSSNVTVTSDGTPTSLVVPVTGDGLYSAVSLAAAGEPDLMIDLGDSRVGVEQTKTVTVTNTGETTVTVDTPTSDSARCTITSALPAAIAPGTSVDVTVHVLPTAVGAGECTITVTSTVPSTDTVIVAWQGVAPEVELTAPSPAALDFGVVDVDDAAAIKTVVLHNTGGAPLAIGPCTVTGSTRFHVATSCTNLSIAPGETATLMVEYDPTLEAQDAGTLTITVDALSTNAVVVDLAGTGADQRIDFSTLDVAFPDTTVGDTNAPIAYVDVHNPANPATGTAEPLHITSAVIDNDTFTLANTGPFTVEANGMIRLAITFTPPAAGTFDGVLVLTSDASSQPMAQITVHGRGISVGGAEGGCCDTRSSTPGTNLLLVVLVLGLVLRARASRP